MLGGNRSLRHSNRDQRLPHLLVSEQNLILHRIAPYCLQCQQHTVVHHDTAKAAGSAVLTRTLRRLVRMQAVCALAQRKLRITATSTSFASPGRSTANSNSYSAALLILASRQECSWLTQSLASVARTFSQAAVAEQPQADIQLTEAAVEVSVADAFCCTRSLLQLASAKHGSTAAARAKSAGVQLSFEAES